MQEALDLGEPEPMFCPSCGKEIAATARFCPRCGRELTHAIPLGAQQSVTPVNRTPVQNVSPPTDWHPATTPELGGPARRMPTNRGLLKLLFFGILTLGIYSFWFIYDIAKDINTMCEDDDQNTGGLLAFILFSFLTLGIYPVYWWYKIANRLHANGFRYGIPIVETGTTYLLWQLIGLFTFGIGGLIANYTVIKNINRFSSAYNKAHGF